MIEGKLTIEEAQVSPLRTILVNAIGVSADVGVEMAHVTLKRGDRMLLCSRRPARLLPGRGGDRAAAVAPTKPGEALKEMVELAKTRGGHDNITGVAIHVVEVVERVPGTLDRRVDAAASRSATRSSPTSRPRPRSPPAASPRPARRCR